MPVAAEYVLYNKRNELTMIGTIKEISNYLGRCESSVRATISRVKHRKCKSFRDGYSIYPLEEKQQDVEFLLLNKEQKKNHTAMFSNFALYSDKTMQSLTKDRLIEYIHELYQNWESCDKKLITERKQNYEKKV